MESMDPREPMGVPEVAQSSPSLEALEDFHGGLLLLRGEGEIFFVNRAARETLSSLGVGTPHHVRDLPPQLRSAVQASRPMGEGEAPALRKLTEGLWGVQLPVTEVDPEWLRGMVEAEQLAAVGQLAATVAQEIGGPNTSIQVAVDHLLERVPGARWIGKPDPPEGPGPDGANHTAHSTADRLGRSGTDPPEPAWT